MRFTLIICTVLILLSCQEHEKTPDVSEESKVEEFIPMDKKMISKNLGVFDVRIFVERDGQPVFTSILNKFFPFFRT